VEAVAIGPARPILNARFEAARRVPASNDDISFRGRLWPVPGLSAANASLSATGR
jgi:hypothetical protein